MKKTIVILLLALLGGTHAYSQTELYGTSLRIGKIGDIGNKNVPVGGLTQQYNIDFTGYRDVRPDQVGARISALRFNYYTANVPYIQNTGLAFYTNPKGNESGDVDLQERMRILPNGNIGIGTTTPSYELHLIGNLYADDIVSPNIYIPTKNVLNGWGYCYLQYTGHSLVIGSKPSVHAHNRLELKPGGSDKGELHSTLQIYKSPKENTHDCMVQFTSQTGGVNYINSGKVGIGTTNPIEMLEVAGTIRAREVKIEINAGADYVFEKDYELLPLSQVKGFIKDNKHLPDIPSEKEMQENGLNVNEFQINLLKKVEELTLYIIQQDDKINKLEKELVKLKSED